MTLAETHLCKKKGYDAESPLCARVILTGSVERVTDSSELAFAEAALFNRHPEMREWPSDHGFYFAKLLISDVCVLDYFGGATTVPVDQYFSAHPWA